MQLNKNKTLQPSPESVSANCQLQNYPKIILWVWQIIERKINHSSDSIDLAAQPVFHLDLSWSSTLLTKPIMSKEG